MVDIVRPFQWGEEERFKFDAYSHAVTTIDQQHRLLHDGMYFTTTGKQTGWADAAEKKFLIRTAAANFPHIQQMLLNFGRGDVDFVAYEGPAVSTVGTPLTIRNPNRTSANTAALLLYGEPTVTDNGAEIFTLWAPPTTAGVGQSANGVQGIGQGSEWILDESTDYLIVMTNNSGSPIDWSYEFSWYEISYDHNRRTTI